VANKIEFFVVHAESVARAKTFYEKAFGWRFEPWGPPDFFLISTGTKDDPGIGGGLQKRHALVDGKEPICFECTISVDDIDATAKAVVAQGGKIIMPKCEIPTVGLLIKFLDPEGNVVCAKQAYPQHGAHSG
jgi:predicted enzyme related to lactoylglutathione lyase